MCLYALACILLAGFFSIVLLIALFFFMSISFPTIFAVATKNLPLNQVKLGGSLLVMSIDSRWSNYAYNYRFY